MKTENEIQILFIDDITQIELDKIKIIKHLKEKINCEVESLILHNKTLSDFIKNIDSLNNYHVILMDHKLNEMSDKNITGASLSGLIKDKWQAIPIIGVTNIDIENGITESKKNIYDDLISKTELINNLS